MDRIINMILNRFIGQIINRAISGGISFAARRGKDPAQMTEAERAQAKAGQDLAQKARKISRASRRLF